MTSGTDTARAHYQQAIDDPSQLLQKLGDIIDRLEPPLRAEKFAAFDQFHVGGLAATAELAGRLRIHADHKILDAGSGLGGPSRFLAETYGCEVVGVDLAPSYVDIAALIAAKAGMADKVNYQKGSITELPFDDACFDLVWTQHVVMNIPDRSRVYREFRRVLKPGGQLAFYDPYLPVDGLAPHYPMPWAATPEASTLLTESDTTAVLQRAGFKIREWSDVTAQGLAWIGRQQQTQQLASTSSVPSIGWIVGPRMGEMVANFGRNLMEGRVRLVMAICHLE